METSSGPSSVYNSGKQRVPWTLQDKRFLKYNWGEIPTEEIAQTLNRTVIAVIGMTKTLNLGSPNKGLTSLSAAVRKSGYAECRIKDAVRALRLFVRRGVVSDIRHLHAKSKQLAFTDEQLEKVYAFLKTIPDTRAVFPKKGTNGAWGEFKKPPVCLGCSTADRPHVGSGYCAPCHVKNVSGVWNIKGRPNGCVVCGTTEKPHKVWNLCGRCYRQHIREDKHERRPFDITGRCDPGTVTGTCGVVGYVRPQRKRLHKDGTSRLTGACRDSKKEARTGRGLPRGGREEGSQYPRQVHLRELPGLRAQG